jgi:hypothetical protein
LSSSCRTLRNTITSALLILLLTLIATESRAAEKPRLLVLTDIGGDPDDQQSLIRLLLYANEFEIDGLIATASGTPGELKEAITRPDLIREIVEAYGKVHGNADRTGERHWENAACDPRAPRRWHTFAHALPPGGDQSVRVG